DHVVLTHDGERRLVMKILPLASHRLMRLRQQCHSLAPAITPFLASCDAPLCRLQRLFSLAIPAGVEDAPAVRQCSESFNAKVYAGFLSGGGKWLYGHIGARKADIPAISLSNNGDSFRRPLEGT